MKNDGYLDFEQEFGEEFTLKMFEDYYDKNEKMFRYNKFSDGMRAFFGYNYDGYISTRDDTVEVEFNLNGTNYYAVIRDGNVCGSDVIGWGKANEQSR